MLRPRNVLIALLLAGAANAQETPLTLQVQLLGSGFTRICDIAHCGDSRIFIVQQTGQIRIRDGSGNMISPPFLDISDRVNYGSEEQGLPGLAFDPDYANNGYFYVDYIGGSGYGVSRISRFSVTSNPNVADPSSEEILYTQVQPWGNHKGGDIAFGPNDGYLYIGFGDGGEQNDPSGNGQNMATALGKILRIDVSGASGWTVPPDNPFVGVSGALPEIWAVGLRNPWRWGFDRVTGNLWIGDVGQNAIEEVDFWPAGDNSGPNFGWRCYEANSPNITGGCLPQSNYVAPIAAHPHSDQGWCSVIGGRVYRGDAYWRLEGKYIYTDYCAGHIYSLEQDALGGWVRTQLLSTNNNGFSCIGENAAGELFIGDNYNYELYRITEACTAQPPVITPDDAVLTSSDALTYQWYMDSSPLPNETDQTFTPTVSGYYHVLATVNTGCVLASETIFFNMQGTGEREEARLLIRPILRIDRLWVEADLPLGGRVQVIDAQGRVVVDHRTSAAGPMSVGLSDIANGNYVVRVASADGALIGQRTIAVKH